MGLPSVMMVILLTLLLLKKYNGLKSQGEAKVEPQQWLLFNMGRKFQISNHEISREKEVRNVELMFLTGSCSIG